MAISGTLFPVICFSEVGDLLATNNLVFHAYLSLVLTCIFLPLLFFYSECYFQSEVLLLLLITHPVAFIYFTVSTFCVPVVLKLEMNWVAFLNFYFILLFLSSPPPLPIPSQEVVAPITFTYSVWLLMRVSSS